MNRTHSFFPEYRRREKYGAGVDHRDVAVEANGRVSMTSMAREVAFTLFEGAVAVAHFTKLN